MFSDTARILMPSVVAFTNQARPSIRATAKARMKIWLSVTTAPKTSNETAGRKAGNGSGRRLTNSITTFCRMIATPSALSIGASREAPLQRPVGGGLDADAEQADRDEGRRRRRRRRAGSPSALAGQARRRGQQEEGDVPADHEHFAMGEIDQAQDAVDHRVAERDQGVDRPDRQGVDELLDQESGHDAPARIRRLAAGGGAQRATAPSIRR